MAFRYLIYRTDYGNTIVRESPTNTSTGGTESALYSEFIIPEIQPIYLWRISGGTSVVPNTDTNINNWLDAISPPLEGEDNATVSYVTGLTSNKIDTVSGVTGQVPVFTADGNIEDSGYSIAELTGGTGSGVSVETFTGYTASTDTRITSIETDLNTVSATTESKIDKVTGATGNLTQFTVDGNIEDSGYSISDITGSSSGVSYSVFNAYTGATDTRISAVESDITSLSAETANKLNTTVFINYSAATDSRLDGIDSQISYISGITDTKLNISDFNSYTGTTDSRLSTIESDITGLTSSKLDASIFNSYTGTTDTRLTGIESDITSLSAATGQAITGASNGLTKSGQNVILGGTLTQDTVISGITRDFTMNVQDINLQSTGVINLLDTAGSGINLESDGGSVDIIGNTSLGVETTKISVSETSLTITDNRGSTTGLQYAADYSGDFVSRSLVDKGYVDSVASGLIPKASVNLTTTVNIDLTGATFGGSVDGITVQDGWRVLVKDQTIASENGIYDYASGTNTFTRSTDFDGTPDGEVSDGNIIPVITGSTNYNTIWVLVTSNPISIDVTDLTFTLFSKPHELISGTGISIVGNTISVDGSSLAGNSISWTGNTFNVDVSSGTLATALGSKLNTTVFDTYTGTTETRLSGIESDITSLSGETATKLETSIFNGYTGTTETRLSGIESDITALSAETATKLDESIFTGYTASTVSNEIYLVHTGGSELNNVVATGIVWDSTEISGTSYLWTGGTDIIIQETGEYEISYNIPFTSGNNNRTIAIAGNIVLNNSTIIDNSSAGAVATNSGVSVNVALPTIPMSLSANDIITLATFRTGDSGIATSSPNASIYIKKKNRLQ